MRRGTKLLEAARTRPTNLRFEELLALARAAGFGESRQRGSHHVLSRPGLPGRMVFQPRSDGKAKAYQVRQLLEAIERLGIGLE